MTGILPILLASFSTILGILMLASGLYSLRKAHSDLAIRDAKDWVNTGAILGAGGVVWAVVQWWA